MRRKLPTRTNKSVDIKLSADDGFLE